MAKRKKINGKWYRKRRGKLVEIPSKWLGKTVHNQTISKRQSKKVRKLRMRQKFKDWNWYRPYHINPCPILGQPKNQMAPHNQAPRHRKINKIEF